MVEVGMGRATVHIPYLIVKGVEFKGAAASTLKHK